MSQKKLKILVTGGAGFIGSHLVDALIKADHHVLVLDDLSTGYKANVNQRARFIKMNINSPKLFSTIKDFGPQVIFHLAAQKLIKISMEQPSVDAEINIIGSLNLLQAAKATKVRKFIFISTGGAIYDEHAGVPSKEESRAKPISPYALSKLTFEQYLAMLAGQDLSWTILRLANVYGPRQDPHGEGGVVAIFSKALTDKKNLYTNGQGRQTRDYIYVDDVVTAMLATLKARAGIYNIGTQLETSVLQLVKMLQVISRQSVKVKHRRAIAGEVQRSALDYHKAKRYLAWSPHYSLAQGLALTYRWFQKK